MNYYANVLASRKEELLSISKYVVVDAYFSKAPFVSTLSLNGFDIVTRLRDDANLLYKYYGKKKEGRGRPKKHEGKIDYNKLKEEYFTLVQ
ncbi:MAG: transposase, partial [Flavobacteriia bacterium]|nr:transposase [Flavobacteriia bacterium]